MRLLATALTLALTTLAATAQTPMTAAEFDAYVTGKTITYHQFGLPYGIEEYLPDRKVRWAFSEDECQYGRWYEEDSSICFVYEYDPEPQCWTFWTDARGLNGLFNGNAPEAALVEAGQSTTGLPCPGPDVGV